METTIQLTEKAIKESTAHLTEKGQRDFKLIKMAIETNDQKAYRELVANYRDSIFFMMLKMTNNSTDAEDLTFEAFGRAFKNLHKYSSNNTFSTWLFRIAINNGIDFMRRKRRGIQVVGKENEELNGYIANKIQSGTLNPEEEFIRGQKIAIMRKIVDQLKPHYKRLVELRYFKEYSYEELVLELDLPLGTVKAQLFRAREFMFNIMRNSRERF